MSDRLLEFKARLKAWLRRPRGKAPTREAIIADAQAEMKHCRERAKQQVAHAIQQRNILRGMLDEQRRLALRLKAEIAAASKAGDQKRAGRLEREWEALLGPIIDTGTQYHRAIRQVEAVQRAFTRHEKRIRRSAVRRLERLPGHDPVLDAFRLDEALRELKLDYFFAAIARSSRRAEELLAKQNSGEHSPSEYLDQLIADLERHRSDVSPTDHWPPDDHGNLGPPTASAPVVPR
jgi:hypothetical protein